MAHNQLTPEKLIAINDDWTEDYKGVPRLIPESDAVVSDQLSDFLKDLREMPFDLLSDETPHHQFGILKFHLNLSKISSELRLKAEEDIFDELCKRRSSEGWVLLLCHDGPERFSVEGQKKARSLQRFTLAPYGSGSGVIYGKEGLILFKRYFESEDDAAEDVAIEIDQEKSLFKILKPDNVDRVWRAYSWQPVKDFLFDLRAQAILAEVVKNKEEPAVKRFRAQLQYLHQFLASESEAKADESYGLTDLSRLYSLRNFLEGSEFLSLFGQRDGWDPTETGQWESWLQSLENAIFQKK